MRKPVFGVSDQVLHKPGCAITEYGKRLEISDLESRVIVLSVQQKQGYREADLRLCFRICRNPVFSRRGSFNTYVFDRLFGKRFKTQISQSEV